MEKHIDDNFMDKLIVIKRLTKLLCNFEKMEEEITRLNVDNENLENLYGKLYDLLFKIIKAEVTLL